MILLRYLLFAGAGLGVALLLSSILNVAITVTEDESTGFIERWINRITCDKYELSGTVRDAQGAPIPFAVIEALYLERRLATRSGEDGRFRLIGDRKTCDEQPEVVSVFVSADDFREKRRVLEYAESTLDIVLDRTDF